MQSKTLNKALICLSLLGLSLAQNANATEIAKANKKPFLWENATVYFLLTDRFKRTEIVLSGVDEAEVDEAAAAAAAADAAALEAVFDVVAVESKNREPS